MSETAAIRVAVPGGAYEVTIGSGLLDRLGGLMRSVTAAARCALVTDDAVGPLYGLRAADALREAGFEPVLFTVRAGERSKSWSEAGRLLEGLSEAGMGRDCVVVALGGGVVGDLAGFCAATYLRGVPVVQVPTTLLAQVDSAIGGKTGVDLPLGKNLAGAFWQPIAVVADTGCLATLTDREWRSGLAEVAKSAVLDSEAALSALEADAAALAGRDPSAAARAVSMAASLKARVVSGDEREAADRECLNYGHTLAHALERELGYGTVTHGAAVADGMRFAARLSERVLGGEEEWTRRQVGLLDALGLVPTGARCEPRRLAAAMRSDKKVRSGRVRFVLSRCPGEWVVEPVDEEVLLSALTAWCGPFGTGGAA
jgi:3-dehydroquinate synthase